HMLHDSGANGNGAPACLKDALDYARRGWPVIWLPPRKKRPVVEGWQHVATTDPAVIAGWWAETPTRNVGVQLGPKSNLIDVECDTPEAEAALVGLLGGEAPVVPTWQSVRGKHRLFLWTPDLPFPDNAVFRFRGIEFRSRSGGKAAQSMFP